MPSSSQITAIGSGTATSSTMSTVSPAAIRSRNLATTPSAISAIRGRRSSTVRGVNARPTSERSRVCCGGSVLSMCALMLAEWSRSRTDGSVWRS
ncbi:hypothetical protein BJF78_16235 [Pseudonocardia sp. CNS-139]|nr:hypothetical protein BJF78_16235 [Pseudonocardia sp. CNS-139]